jgi:alcohol dehydrogenase class IV
MTALAHDLGHALGAVFHVPHGRAVSLCLPYTIEFTANAGGSRYAEIARFMHWPAYHEMEGAASLVIAIRNLRQQLNEPVSIQALGISEQAFTEALPHLITNAELDTDIITSPRQPSPEELRRLFQYMYTGKTIDF